MNILICDDKIDYVNELKKNIDFYMKKHNVSVNYIELTSGEEAINNKTNYDIAFLDVEMEGINGIDTARELKKNNKNIVIFIVTAFGEYMDDAMDLYILRFFNKPLKVERLYKGLEKALELIDDTVIEFYLKNDGSSIVQVPINSIIYIEIVDKKTKVVTNDETYFSYERIKYWREKLIHSYFYSVHGSFIVNMNYITNYSRDEIVLNNKYKIPIAYRKRSEFRKCFLNIMENR